MRHGAVTALRRSFFWKLYLSYAVLVLTSATVIGTLVLGDSRNNALREITDNLLKTTRLIAAMEAANPAHLWSDQLARQITEVAGDTGLHLTFLFANGTTAAESLPSRPALRRESVWTLPEFAAARRSAWGSAVRPLEDGRPEHLFLAVPILLEYEVIGYVRAGMSLTLLAQREADLRRRVLAGMSVNALIALGLGFFFARNVTRPLAQIRAVCRRMAAGDLSERITHRRIDEIGVVADTINQMAGEVQKLVYDEKRERQRLATLLAVMGDGVVAVSARETIAYLNEVAAKLLSLEAAAATGKTFRDTVRVAGVLEVYAEALTAEKRVLREVRLAGYPAHVIIRVDATPLRDRAGGRFGVLLVLHDLTELRRLEEVRRTFAANVSHELKTPITAVASLVDTLIEDAAMVPAVRARFLGKIRRQNERLQALVQDLLIISRLESERAVLERRELDLTPVLTDCVQTFEEVAQHKQLRLSWEPPRGEVLVKGNDEALKLILNNLLHNAVSYTPAGGRIEVALVAGGGIASVTVRDTGAGIAAEHLGRIFERFYRVDPARARDAGGSGLGLSIVKHLTHALDGRVFVESRPGEGTVFTVQLPVA